MVWFQVVEEGQQKRFEMPQFACPFFFYRLFCTKCNRKSLKKGYWILYNFKILLIRVLNHWLLKVLTVTTVNKIFSFPYLLTHFWVPSRRFWKVNNNVFLLWRLQRLLLTQLRSKTDKNWLRYDHFSIWWDWTGPR